TGARSRASRGNPAGSASSPSCRLTDHAPNSARKPLPVRASGVETVTAVARDLVFPSLPSGMTDPAAFDEVFLLEAVEDRVHRSLLQIEYPAAVGVHQVDHRIPVSRTAGQGGQQQHVQMAAEDLPLHVRIPSAARLKRKSRLCQTRRLDLAWT